MQLPAPLRGFLTASVLFTFLCLGTEAFCRWALHWGNPYIYPGLQSFYDGNQHPVWFADFHAFFDKFHFFHSRLFYTQSAVLPYPAPAVAAYEPFLIPAPYPHHGMWALARFEGTMLLVSWFLLWCWQRALAAKGLKRGLALAFVLVAYLCSFAFWFEFLQGNIEWIVWSLLTIAVWAFYRQHLKTAAICIGIAGSMKLFPIIYLGLFLAGRRYRQVAYTLLAAAVSTVVSLWLVCPDIAYSWHQTVRALTSFEHDNISGVLPQVIGFNHSLFALANLVLATLLGVRASHASLGLYLLVVGVGGIVLFFTRIRHLPFTNQVLSLSIAAILLPPVSYDYTLLHLYPGLVLLSLYALHRERDSLPSLDRPLLATLVVLAFLLSPESELIWHGVRYAGQVKAVALLGLGYLCLRYPFSLPMPLRAGRSSQLCRTQVPLQAAPGSLLSSRLSRLEPFPVR